MSYMAAKSGFRKHNRGLGPPGVHKTSVLDVALFCLDLGFQEANRAEMPSF
jgi:hypothetical protein